MPLTFQKRNPEEFKAVSAAQVVNLTIDLLSNRILGTIVYGNIQGGGFVENKNYPPKVVVIDGPAFARIASLRPDATKTIYTNIKEIFWQEALAQGAENGVIS